MTDSHNVPFRDSDDQPCPNCGAIVEKFEEASRHDYYAGYECTDCDVRWSWEEWADGVEKHPDPDPQHEATPLEQRQLAHCFTDLCNAVERDRFQVETPRVHVGQTPFERVDIGTKRDTHRMGPLSGGESVVRAPQPYLEVTLEWEASEEEHYGLASDLRAHGALEGPCILYGDMHLWRMEEQHGLDLSSTHPVGGGSGACTARFEWRAVEPVGWR